MPNRWMLTAAVAAAALSLSLITGCAHNHHEDDEAEKHEKK